MKKKIFIASLLLIVITSFIRSQCREFTDTAAIPKMEDYILTGRYHSFLMKEGDEVLIFKTLNKNIKYKFVIAKEQSLQTNIHFVIKDWSNNILFDNSLYNYSLDWEYFSDRPQKVKIYIDVPKIHSNPSSGCVSLLIGMKKI